MRSTSLQLIGRNAAEPRLPDPPAAGLEGAPFKRSAYVSMDSRNGFVRLTAAFIGRDRPTHSTGTRTIIISACRRDTSGNSQCVGTALKSYRRLYWP